MLARALRAITQLDYPEFEVVVVGDGLALGAAERIGRGAFKLSEFDEPNLSVARNIGIAAAAGDVCAFIDDDAVPEPKWLHHHSAALAGLDAVASVGFVRGPDGIRFQSRHETIDAQGWTSVEHVSDGQSPFVSSLKRDQATKLVGTNMAIRRDALIAMHGFDPVYRYYLEDSDLSWRLGQSGQRIAVTPLAEVHHAIAASTRRAQRGVPRSLSDVGRSSALFVRKHSRVDLAIARKSIRAREQRRLLQFMIRGVCEPRDVERILSTFDSGWEDGNQCAVTALRPLTSGNTPFRAFRTSPVGHRIYTSRVTGRRRALAAATKIVESNEVAASIISISLTSLPHRVQYTQDGVWLHTGGQFNGKGRMGLPFKWCRFAKRTSEEIARVAKQRGLVEAETGCLDRRLPD